MSSKLQSQRVLPGFGITLGFTLTYLSLIVLIPLSALVFKTFTLTWEQFVFAVSSPRVLASYKLTFGASFLAALVNAVFGLLVIALCSVVMAPLGVKAAHALPVQQLRRVFAVLLYMLAGYMLYRGLTA